MEASEQQQRTKAFWAKGDYEKVGAHFGPAAAKALEATGIGSGDRVLDVACGTGNATIPAAETGATVTGLDITPELLARPGPRPIRRVSRSTSSKATPGRCRSRTAASTA